MARFTTPLVTILALLLSLLSAPAFAFESFADEGARNNESITPMSLSQVLSKVKIKDFGYQVNIDLPEGLGKISVATTLWRIRIVSEVPAEKKLNVAMVDWATPYRITITLDYGAQRVLGDDQNNPVVRTVNLEGDIRFNTKDEMNAFLETKIIPNLDRPIIVEGYLFTGGSTFFVGDSSGKVTSPRSKLVIDQDMLIPMVLTNIRPADSQAK